MSADLAKDSGYQPLESGQKTDRRPRVYYRWLVLVSTISAVAGLAYSLAGIPALGKHDPKGCEADYWKQKCRLDRGDKHEYRNFLARAGLLLPPALHVTVTEEQLGRGRLLVVGDVHGCREELLKLLEKANYTHGLDNLVLAGDLVDKGPYPIEAIAEARRLGAMSVRGNHDDSALAAFEAIQRGEKVKDKHKWVHKLSEADAHWIGQLPWTISIPSHSLLVVHAGVVPEVPLEDQLLVDLYRMRELAPGDDTKWHGLEANPDRGQGVPWAQVWGGPQHIVFGHDHQRGLQDETYATGVDTGVVYGDFLTGVLFPNLLELKDLKLGWANASSPVTLQMLGAEIIQVKAKKKYY